MGKGPDKRRRRPKKQRESLTEELNRITFETLERLSASDPPTLDEPDAPVFAPLKPRPNLRSGSVAVPEPEPEENH